MLGPLANLLDVAGMRIALAAVGRQPDAYQQFRHPRFETLSPDGSWMTVNARIEIATIAWDVND